jgi:hypothetical protein
MELLQDREHNRVAGLHHPAPAGSGLGLEAGSSAQRLSNPASITSGAPVTYRARSDAR